MTQACAFLKGGSSRLCFRFTSCHVSHPMSLSDQPKCAEPVFDCLHHLWIFVFSHSFCLTTVKSSCLKNVNPCTLSFLSIHLFHCMLNETTNTHSKTTYFLSSDADTWQVSHRGRAERPKEADHPISPRYSLHHIASDANRLLYE